MSHKGRKDRGVVVCISGLTASGKSTVARMLAERYNLNYYSGGGMLKEVAVEMGYSPSGEDWWGTEDGKRFLKERLRNFEYDRIVDQKLLKKAEEMAEGEGFERIAVISGVGVRGYYESLGYRKEGPYMVKDF